MDLKEMLSVVLGKEVAVRDKRLERTAHWRFFRSLFITIRETQSYK